MVETITDLCIVTAIDIEFKIAADLLSEKSLVEEPRMKICRGFFGARRVTILQSEIGAAGFAERLAKHLESDRYDALIVAGLAGAIDRKLRVGDAVLYDLCYDARAIDLGQAPGECRANFPVCSSSRQEPPEGTRANWKVCSTLSEEAAVVACNEMLSELLFNSVAASGLRCVRGSGVTVSRIVIEARSKLKLGARYGASTVDMETFEALSACARLNLPAAALRVISDEAARDIPDFNRAYDADGRMNGRRMAGAMIARPVAALRFLLSVRRALVSLKENLRAVLNA